MPRRTCPQCESRLPYAARRCRHCGWGHGRPVDPDTLRRRTRRRRVGWAVLTLLLLLGTGLAVRNATGIADWYAGFAARYLPGAMAAFAPTDTERGAFFFCARQVAREMDGEFSVETFPSLEQSVAVELGRGRYRIESFVDEAREDGAQVRRGFVCLVRYERGRWALEDLRMEQLVVSDQRSAMRR